jgi:HEAT repeat protein
LDATQARKRAWGADILGQVASASDLPNQGIADVLLKALANERVASVVASILIAIRHTEDRRGYRAALVYAANESVAVREAVAFTLAAHSDVAGSVPALVRLARDPAADVRNWAMFGLATSVIDRKSVTNAFRDGLRDSDARVRVEALIGLLHRGDKDVIGAVGVWLREPSVRAVAGRLAAELGATAK